MAKSSGLALAAVSRQRTWTGRGVGSSRVVHGEADGEVVGVGVGGGVEAAHVEGIAAAVGEALALRGARPVARGGEGLGHGVVGHACTRAVATGGGFVG